MSDETKWSWPPARPTVRLDGVTAKPVVSDGLGREVAPEHTPGPWVAVPSAVGAAWYVRSDGVAGRRAMRTVLIQTRPGRWVRAGISSGQLLWAGVRPSPAVLASRLRPASLQRLATDPSPGVRRLAAEARALQAGGGR